MLRDGTLYSQEFRDSLAGENPDWLGEAMIETVRSTVTKFSTGYTVPNLLGSQVFLGFYLPRVPGHYFLINFSPWFPCVANKYFIHILTWYFHKSSMDLKITLSHGRLIVL